LTNSNPKFSWHFEHPYIQKSSNQDHFGQNPISSEIPDSYQMCGNSWGVYNTYGKYYGLLIVKARVDETVLSALLSVGIEGNVRTLTLKAFTEFEGIKKIEQLSWASFVVSILKRKMLIIILCL
jgi:hypothetical protein